VSAGSSPITDPLLLRKHTRMRALPSASVTRLQRYSDPLRLPVWPPASRWRSRRDLYQHRVSPNYPDHLPDMLCPLPRWTRTGALVGSFPVLRGLPRYSGGSASTTSLSRPARALHALRPARLLTHQMWALSRGFDPTGQPVRSLVSYHVNR